MSFAFPGYGVETQLYDGPGSHVYRARRSADGAPVILKVLKPAHPSPERLARFRREFETLRSLSIPGAVGALGLEEDEGHRFALVQEDIGGVALDRLPASRRLSTLERIDLALQIAEALGQLHEQDVIHKDVNPSNVVWNEATGRVALIDLGIATRLSREHATLRHPDRLEGTLAYIAPEQTGRMNRDIDHRTDFYSLGVTLYQLFTGALPFASQDPLELIHSHLARSPAPPHEVAPEVPAAVSAIILKLMSKMAEERYQSSFGIQEDLRACAARLRETGAIGDLVIGAKDVSERFHVPQRLYGRDHEVATLLAAFERVSGSGRAEMVVVTGYSGIGKSALVSELSRPITGRRGFFAAGKFDQLNRSAPYAGVASAFRSLARQILGERAPELAAWRDRILAALGPNGRLITDIMPEIELVIGPQPPVAELGPTEAQNRFTLVFQAFVRACARGEHPLVLFLDDLQWADSASLRLIELMMTGEPAGHLLLIGAYRDNEVDEAHPLTMSLTALREAGAPVAQIHVPPLPLEHVAEVVASALHADAAAVAPLAELVLRKTAGNPLFVTQILKEVHEAGLITLDRREGKWRWDIARIEAHGITDNVVELMVGKLRRKEARTREVLEVAACLGNRFSLETLAIVRGEPLAAVFAALFPAIDEELVLPASDPEIAVPEVVGAPLAAREYRFLHDRVQQAAYSLMDADERTAVHLRVGRLLQKGIPAEERAERVFEIVDQLNHGRRLIDDPEERAELVRLDVVAGKKAKAATAYAAAREYLLIAAELLPKDAWERDYDLAATVYRELAEAESLVSNYARSDALAREMLERVRTSVEKAEIYNVILLQQTLMGQFPAAITASRQGLAMCGFDMPTENLEGAFGQEAARIGELFGDRPIGFLLDAPLVQEPRARTAMKILVNTIPASFYAYTNRLGYALGVLKTVRISLEFGLSPQSADTYAYYGHLLSSQQQRYRAGFELGELSIRLSEKLKAPGDKCRSAFVLADFMLVWVKHIREARPLNDDGYAAGLEAGEFLFAGYILYYKLQHLFYDGTPLEKIAADLPAYLQFCQRAKNQLAIDFVLGLRRALGTLTGAAAEETTADAFLEACERHQSAMAICYHHVLTTQIRYLHGDPAGALQAAAAAEGVMPAVAGNVAIAEHTLYASLAHAALAVPESDARAEHVAALAAGLGRLTGWAAACPENFEHMRALVAAEQARVEGRTAEAADLYDHAIEDARQNGFAQDEALAHELSGRCWMARGRRQIGVGYLAEALHGYQRWGATVKAKALAGELPELADRKRGERGTGATVTSTDERDASALDLSSVLKASTAISTEIVLEKLLTKLMGIVIENAGAERGVLLLERGGELLEYVSASASQTASQRDVVVEIKEPRPVSDEQVAVGIVAYVQRTREIVLLGDASHEGPFTESAYVRARRPKSILVMPLFVQRKLLGVLYLENNLAVGAFTPSRTEVLELLSSQIGISLENALLYGEMEQRVAERTAELQGKNEDLEEALQRLSAAQAQLVHAEKMASLGRLTAGIAHEIKNPLNFINNFAALNAEMSAALLAGLRKDPGTRLADVREELSDLNDAAASIVDHGRRADGIIRSMTLHGGGGAGPGERRPAQLNALLEQHVAGAHRDLLAERPDASVVIERDYDPTLGDVDMNPQEIGRVFANLLSNAFYAVTTRKAAPGAPFTPTVGVSTRRLGASVEIHVKDNGAGIPAAILGRIFEPFFTTKPSGVGTGLGLPLSYDVVKAHHGAITVASDEDRGATFTVTLPGGAPA